MRLQANMNALMPFGRAYNFSDLTKTLQTIISVLNANNFSYAIGGSIALGVYTRPKNTADINIFMMADEKEEAHKKLIKTGFKIIEKSPIQFVISKKGFDFKFLSSSAHPEIAGIVNSNKAKIFNIKNIRVFPPEYLAYILACSVATSNKRHHRVSLHNLLNSKHIDTDLLKKMIASNKDNHLLGTVNAILEGLKSYEIGKEYKVDYETFIQIKMDIKLAQDLLNDENKGEI
jgi:hypothetical protein